MDGRIRRVEGAGRGGLSGRCDGFRRRAGCGSAQGGAGVGVEVAPAGATGGPGAGVLRWVVAHGDRRADFTAAGNGQDAHPVGDGEASPVRDARSAIMNPRADHEEVSELLAAAALEILEGSERLRVYEHVRECAACRRMLDQYNELVVDLGLLQPSPAADPDRSARLRARLLARASADAMAAHPRNGPGTARSRWAAAVRDRWSGWLVAASLVGVLLMHHGFHRPLNHGWIVAGALAIACVALLAYARMLYLRSK